MTKQLRIFYFTVFQFFAPKWNGNLIDVLLHTQNSCISYVIVLKVSVLLKAQIAICNDCHASYLVLLV